jgi:hypothetical protein
MLRFTTNGATSNPERPSNQLSQSIKQIEKLVLAMSRELPCYEALQSLPGVGSISALAITLETAQISPFCGYRFGGELHR